MKGDKKKSHKFKKGNVPWNKGISTHCADSNEACVDSSDVSDPPSTQIKANRTVRMTEEEYYLVTNKSRDGTSRTMPDCEGSTSSTGSTRLLRPARTPSSDLKTDRKAQDTDGMRLVDNDKMVESWNTAYRLHRQESSQCDMPHMVIANERKWGVCWRLTLRCVNCEFHTPEFKLYREIISNKPGPNPGAPNIGLGIGLQDTPLGNKGARLLMSNMDMPPPARSSMQRTSKIVSKTVKDLNDRDMAQKVEMLKDINIKRGHEASEINIAMDGRYNSVTIASRKKTGQNASQAIGVACETMTDKKFVIQASFKNKLCWTGNWLKGKGIDVQCPGGHPECTANMSVFQPFSEYDMGHDIGSQLALQGMLIKYATTDGDSRSAEGIDHAMKSFHPMWNVQRLADPTHLGQSQFRKCNQADFSQEMFPGRTREQRKQQQKVLSQDIKARCSLILKELMMDFAGDMNSLRRILPKVLESTLACYDGDCSRCSSHSVVCNGGVTNNWWTRSMFLASNRLFNLNMNENDKQLLLEILKMKLSVAAVEQMKLYTDTQKCEAVNRALSVSLPKNVNFSATMEGRASSAIHRINNDPGTSSIKKCESAGIKLSTRAKRALRSFDVEAEYSRDYATRSEVVKQKLIQHSNKIQEHSEYKRVTKTKSDYRKGQLDASPSTSGLKNDHTY